MMWRGLTLLLCLVAQVTFGADATLTWTHDGSGWIDAASQRQTWPLAGFHVYQAPAIDGPYRMTHELDATVRSASVAMAYEPTSWFKVTALAGNGEESVDVPPPVSKTVATPPPPPPPPPAPALFSLIVLGTDGQAANLPWGVEARSSVTDDAAVEWVVNGGPDVTTYAKPWCVWGRDANGQCLTTVKPAGTYVVSARLFVRGILTASQSVTLRTVEAAPPPPPPPPVPTDRLVVTTDTHKQVVVSIGACPNKADGTSGVTNVRSGSGTSRKITITCTTVP